MFVKDLKFSISKADSVHTQTNVIWGLDQGGHFGIL